MEHRTWDAYLRMSSLDNSRSAENNNQAFDIEIVNANTNFITTFLKIK